MKNELLSLLGALPIAIAPALCANETFYEPRDTLLAILVGKENVLRHASAQADNHWGCREPAFAVDGKTDNSNDHWAGLNLPVSLTADMRELHEISVLRIVLYWPGGRVYQYFLEGSADGET